MSSDFEVRPIHCHPAQVAGEAIGMLSDLIAKLRERDARGDSEAIIDLEFLADDLCSLLGEYTDIANDADPNAQQQEAA